MSYYIKQQFISKNRSYEKFTKTLKGIVIHSTANIGTTSLNHFNYWNNADRQSSIHYIADWIGTEIYQFIPENEVAWHIGNYQANREWLGIELCETNSKEQFNIVWNKTVWFVANLCIRHNWNVDDNVWSHNGLRSLYSGVDHTDPYGYLQRMGKTWQQLCDAIDAEIKSRKSNQIKQTEEKEDDDMLEVAILKFSKEDDWVANDLDVALGGVANFTRQGIDKTIPAIALSAKKLFIVGGSDISSHPNRIYLSGKTKYDTAYEVGKFLKENNLI